MDEERVGAGSSGVSEALGVCDEWPGSRLSSGYGYRKVKGRTVYTHREAWEIAYGPIPDGMQVLHKCDNPPCRLPGHLFLGTQLDNVRDCIAKGRRASADKTRHLGESNGNSKLTLMEVTEIRNKYSNAPRKRRVLRGTLKILASEFGVSPTMISFIVAGKFWKLESGSGLTKHKSSRSIKAHG